MVIPFYLKEELEALDWKQLSRKGFLKDWHIKVHTTVVQRMQTGYILSWKHTMAVPSMWYWFRSPALCKNFRKNCARQCVAGTEALCEAAKGRPTWWCISEDMRDARTREQPLMGAAGVKWSWPKRVTSYGVLCRASGLRLPKPFGAKPVVSWVPDARHNAAEFSVSPDGFLSFFIPILPCYALILPF